MTAGDGGADPTAPLEPPARDVGLWRDRWFRVLTIVNVSIVATSACVGVAMLVEPRPDPVWMLGLAFPVVPATVAAPWLSALIVVCAAALSALNMFGERQKGVRFLRAMTVWGTIVLAIPILFVPCWVAGALW